MTTQKGFARVTLLLFVLAVVILAAGVSGVLLGRQARPQPMACTEEAKLCSDGSAVGRTGPNCDFPPCPQPLIR